MNTLLAKIKTFISRERCYSDMEKHFDAIGGYCIGSFNLVGPDFVISNCITCPHYIQNRSDK